MEIGGWAVSKAIFGDFTFTENDAKSLVLGAVSCTMFPASAMAQGAFLLAAESLYMFARGASAREIAQSAMMHTLGIAGGQALSKFAARAWSRVASRKLSPEYLRVKSQRGIPDNILNMARKADLKQIDRIAKEVGGLTAGQRRLLHDTITHQNYTLNEIREIAKQIKQLYPNK